MISPFAKQNYIAHNQTSQASILQFIEDNWNLGRIGDGSFDKTAGSLDPMFPFGDRDADNRTILDPTTGAIIGGRKW